MNELYDYAVRCYRHLHQYPEVGFELPETAAFVKAELEKMGIATTDRYGTCSVVGHIGSEGKPVIALRADMDALPVTEKTGLPFASCKPGMMHACGHDSHTAILLAVAKKLKSMEKELPCQVRLMFQPSEEGAVSGAKMMVDNGVMDGVHSVLGIHCENTLATGAVGVYSGDYMAACAPITLEFIGKTSHATIPDGGVDAIAMAYEAYGRLKQKIAEIAGDNPYIWSVGTFQGGTVHNVIAEYCKMDISFRFYNMEMCNRMEQETNSICTDIAQRFGGKYKLDWHISTGPVHNDAKLAAFFEKQLLDKGLAVKTMAQRMSSEDFGWYLTKAPGLLFRYGSGTKGKGTAHQNDFVIDEEGLTSGIEAFVTFVMNSGEYLK